MRLHLTRPRAPWAKADRSSNASLQVNRGRFVDTAVGRLCDSQLDRPTVLSHGLQLVDPDIPRIALLGRVSLERGRLLLLGWLAGLDAGPGDAQLRLGPGRRVGVRAYRRGASFRQHLAREKPSPLAYWIVTCAPPHWAAGLPTASQTTWCSSTDRVGRVTQSFRDGGGLPVQHRVVL